jgi:DNA-directed RNA polymerase subunit RPC12/RpoP
VAQANTGGINTGETNQPSVEQFVNQARGSISERDLTSTGNPLRTFLFDKPLIEYLDETEQPHYLFRNDSRGVRVVTANGDEETPHHNWNSIWTRGHRHLLVTDKRLLYIVGSKDGDEIAEFDYDDITDVTGNQGILTSTLTFTDTEGREFTFATRKGKYEVSDAAEYIQHRLDGVTVTEETTSEEATCPNCSSAIDQNDKFCSECGTDLHAIVCPECGSSMEDSPNFCPECGYELQNSSEDTDEATKPAYTWHSYFAAVMLLWWSAYASTVVNQSGESLLFLAMGVAIVPPVRRRIVETTKDALNIDLSVQAVRVVVGAVYALFVAGVALVMIGSGANDPTMSAWSGVGAIIIAGIVAKVAELLI